MPVLTNFSEAEIKRKAKRLYGTVLTRPALMISDGLTEVWACDVNIGPTDPSGSIHQYHTEQQSKDERVDHDPDDDYLTGLPNQRPEDWQLDDSLPGHVDTTLRNVAISRNNKDLIYADVGSPVICDRTESGNWEITGFSIEQPGTHNMYPVDLGTMRIGTVINLTVETRLLTFAEIGEIQPFGVLPFGASAIYKGGALVSVV